MRLTHQEWEDYLRAHAEKAEAEGRMTAMRDKILECLRSGGASPADLPYAVVLEKRNQVKSDWKEATRRVLMRFLRVKDKAEAEMEKIASSFDVSEVEALCVRINKSYRI